MTTQPVMEVGMRISDVSLSMAEVAYQLVFQVCLALNRSKNGREGGVVRAAVGGDGRARSTQDCSSLVDASMDVFRVCVAPASS
jgi:hypothetical protein